MTTEIKFGIITGFSIILYVLLEYYLGFHSTRIAVAEYADYLVFLIPIAPLFFAMNHKRKSAPEGQVPFNRSVATGLTISVISTVIATTFIIFYLKRINPQFGDARIAFESNKLFAEGIPEEIVIQKVNGLRLRFSFGAQIIWTFFGQLIFSTFSTLVVSTFLTQNTLATLLLNRRKKTQQKIR